MPDTQPKVYNTAARDHGTSSKMGEEEGGGGGGGGGLNGTSRIFYRITFFHAQDN